MLDFAEPIIIIVELSKLREDSVHVVFNRAINTLSLSSLFASIPLCLLIWQVAMMSLDRRNGLNPAQRMVSSTCRKYVRRLPLRLLNGQRSSLGKIFLRNRKRQTTRRESYGRATGIFAAAMPPQT